MCESLSSYSDCQKRMHDTRGRVLKKRKLAKNTYLIPNSDGSYAVRLRETDVVTYYPNGEITLYDGGWKSQTTKDRINFFSPGDIWQEKGVWTIKYQGKRYLFCSPMTLYPDGSVADEYGRKLSEYDKDMTKGLQYLRKQVRQYAKDYVENLYSGKIPEPSEADCWYCYMETDEGVSLGESVRHTGEDNHIRSHIRDKYYVPSLIVRVLKWMNAGDFYFYKVYSLFRNEKDNVSWFDPKDRLIRMLRRYCYKEMGLAY